MKNNSLYHVSFPNIGINNIVIDPVAFAIGPIKVHFYGITLALGFLLGFIYVYTRAEEYKIKKDKLADILICGMICGIIGARLYYVVFYPGDFYIRNPIKALCISEGGIAIYGGIIGGLIGVLISAKIKKVNVLSVLDLFSVGLIIGQSIGRWGNFFNQEAFGSITNLPWGMKSENTLSKLVHPCFLYESLWCLLGFIFLHIYSKKSKDQKYGRIFNLYILWYSFGRFFIEGLRTDSLMFIGLRVSQILSFVLFLLSLWVIIYDKFISKNVKDRT